jgi:hypothetical protein
MRDARSFFSDFLITFFLFNKLCNNFKP